MMTSNELLYGDSEPVWVVDSSPYPRRNRASSYESDRYYSSRPGYSRGNSYSRDADYYTGDQYTDIDGYRGAEYYPSRPGYYEREYSPDRYYSGSPTSSDGAAYDDTYFDSRPYGAAYDDTYYDSRPSDYYDYRRPSTVVMSVPICCEGCCEEARNALFQLRGVRSVYCDVNGERVTVIGTAAPADVLHAMRKLHKKARFWGDEDYY